MLIASLLLYRSHIDVSNTIPGHLLTLTITVLSHWFQASPLNVGPVCVDIRTIWGYIGPWQFGANGLMTVLWYATSFNKTVWQQWSKAAFNSIINLQSNVNFNVRRTGKGSWREDIYRMEGLFLWRRWIIDIIIVLSVILKVI